MSSETQSKPNDSVTNLNQTDAPITNEELYVQQKKALASSILDLAVVAGIGAYVALAADSFSFATALLAISVMFFSGYRAVSERGWNTRIWSLILRDSLDETVDELEARLTPTAVTDGGDVDE